MKEEKKNKKRKGPCYTSLIVFHTIPLFLISPLVSHSLSLCSFSLSHHRNCLSLSLRNNTTTTVSVHLYFGSFVGGWAITAPLEQPSPWLSTHSSHLLFYFIHFFLYPTNRIFIYSVSFNFISFHSVPLIQT